MIWKIILPLLTIAALANAGGRTLSPQESTQFLSLFRRYCSSPASGPSQDGNTFYYCKTSDQQPQTLEIAHDAEINAGETPKQVVFVQPPPTNYIHNVALRGSPGNPQQTEIYVLPQTADHTLQLQDTRSSVQAEKPSLFFLQGDNAPGFGGGNGGGSSGGNGGGSSGGNRPPPGVRPGFQGGNGGQRPSSPPPGPSDPGVIGIGTGFQGGSSGGGYQAYGAPGVLSPRNQRNVQQQFKTNAYRTIP